MFPVRTGKDGMKQKGFIVIEVLTFFQPHISIQFYIQTISTFHEF